MLHMVWGSGAGVGRVCGTGLRGESVCGHGGAKEHKVGVRPHGAMEVVRRRWHAYGKSRAVAVRYEGCMTPGTHTRGVLGVRCEGSNLTRCGV